MVDFPGTCFFFSGKRWRTQDHRKERHAAARSHPEDFIRIRNERASPGLAHLPITRGCFYRKGRRGRVRALAAETSRTPGPPLTSSSLAPEPPFFADVR